MKRILNHELWVSEDGNIFSKYGLLKQGKTNKGYLFVRPTLNGKKTYFSVHREVAFAFIPNPHKLPQVGHKDNNKTNNHVNNLYWTNNSENQKKNHNENRVNLPQKLNREQREWIRNNCKKGSHKMGMVQLSKKFNCGYMTIFRIVNGIRWKRD